MMIVEEGSETKLMQRLEQLRDSGKAQCCIEVAFSTLDTEARPSSSEFIQAVQSVFPDESVLAQVYFLADGDAVLLVGVAQPKQIRQLATLLPMARESYIRLHEFNYQFNTVMVRLQEKIDAAHARVQAENARIAQAMQIRRREQILAFTPEEIDIPRLKSARSKRTQREIMIIEDDAFSRRLLENILPKSFHITSVGEPEQALERYVLMVPDILFLDINLPDVSGHELLDKILTIDPQAYVIMISGNSDRDNVIRAMGHGARGFIAKPFARERIQEYIQRCPTMNNELPHAHS